MRIDHETRVDFMRAWNEWRPCCSCGWVGSYWPRESLAVREAAVHVEQQS